MIIGIPKEIEPGECRVALTPASAAELAKAGLEVHVEQAAGAASGFPDTGYSDKGCLIVESRADLFANADMVLQVRTLGASPGAEASDLEHLREGLLVIGLCEALTYPETIRQMAERGATTFAMELIPRITRAQQMDVLSSMATVAGYKAILLAAEALPRMFPMLMTAAGTISPARVFVMGAGVAGLQAIATARRLGAVVEAYDIRPAARQEIESLGAKAVSLDLEDDSAESQDGQGYARAMDEEFYRKQAECIAGVVERSDVVVTTAAVPGKKAPILIPEAMLKGMSPGSVVVDVAAERGGNCESTQAGKTVQVHGVTVIGPVNLPSTIPHHASQMYARNMSRFVLNMVEDGELKLDEEDEIITGTLVTRGGKVVHSRVLEILDADGVEKEKT